MAEKYFIPNDCLELPAHIGPGLYIAGVESTDWYSIETGRVEEAAIELRGNTQFDGISIVGNRPSSVMDGLAVTFSQYLRNLRHAGQDNLKSMCITGIDPPTPPVECVRIPHLVTTRFEHVLSDTVIWELQAVGDAEEWLGAPLTGQKIVEDNLEKIIKIRREFRDGKVAATEYEKELQYQLSKGRYISALFVYQQLDLFRSIIDEIT